MGKASRAKKNRVTPPSSAAGRPAWLLPAAAAGLLAAIAIVLAVVLTGGGSKNGTTTQAQAPTWPADTALPGLLTTKAPWPANQAQMPGRLQALELPLLPEEALTLH